jgi:hypothetical protein
MRRHLSAQLRIMTLDGRVTFGQITAGDNGSAAFYDLKKNL